MTTQMLKDILWELLAVETDEGFLIGASEENNALLLRLKDGDVFRLEIQKVS